MYKEILKKCSKKDLEYIRTSVKATRDKTQQTIDRLLKCKPEKVKDFKRKSGIVDLEKYLRFLNKSLNKLEETIATFPVEKKKRRTGSAYSGAQVIHPKLTGKKVHKYKDHWIIETDATRARRRKKPFGQKGFIVDQKPLFGIEGKYKRSHIRKPFIFTLTEAKEYISKKVRR